MPANEEFLRVLDACSQTSEALLIAMASDTSTAAALMTRRDAQIKRLVAIQPVGLCVGDVEMLKTLLHVGHDLRVKALAEKSSATLQLASLQSALQVARQLAATRPPRQSGVNCTG